MRLIMITDTETDDCGVTDRDTGRTIWFATEEEAYEYIKENETND